MVNKLRCLSTQVHKTVKKYLSLIQRVAYSAEGLRIEVVFTGEAETILEEHRNPPPHPRGWRDWKMKLPSCTSHKRRRPRKKSLSSLVIPCLYPFSRGSEKLRRQKSSPPPPKKKFRSVGRVAHPRTQVSACLTMTQRKKVNATRKSGLYLRSGGAQEKRTLIT